MSYRPNSMDELRTPVKLLVPKNEKHNGVPVNIYPDGGDLLFVNWKTYGGAESVVNGVLSIIDTATVTTWFRPDIRPDCQLLREDGKTYRIISEPENCDLGNMYCRFKVERVKGGG